MKRILSILLVLNSVLSLAQIDAETNFYNAVPNANYNKDLVADYGVDNDFDTDDSAALQSAIDEINSNGGGVLSIPAGNYSFANIDLKSNVHLDIDDAVVIRPTNQSNQNNYRIFGLGRIGNPIENVTITSSTTNKYKVDLTQNNNPNVAVFSCNMVSNFVIGNCEIDDALTKFSSIITGGLFYNNVYTFPTNGIVKDIHVDNAHYGYGVVQTQSAENMLFKNLSGVGGATLRFETGYSGLNNLQVVGEPRIGGLDNMVGRNISSTNGNCAVMVSPHAMHNGTVDVEGITSISSGFAVRVEGGFVSDSYDQDIGLTDGTFENVVTKDVTATFGDQAQLKAKHINPYMPDEYRSLFPETLDYSEIYIGPSIAGLLVDGSYLCNDNEQNVFIENPIVANGFDYQPTAVIPSENETINCGTLAINEHQIDTEFQIYPIPASNFIDVYNLKNTQILNVYSISGQLIKTLNNDNNKTIRIEMSGLTSGMYFVQAISGEKSTIKKMILN